MISMPMSAGVIVRRQRPVLDHAAEGMHPPSLVISGEYLGKITDWNEAVEAKTFIWDKEKVKALRGQQPSHFLQMANKIRLMLQAMAAQYRVKLANYVR